MHMHMNMYHYAAKAIALCLQISHAKSKITLANNASLKSVLLSELPVLISGLKLRCVVLHSTIRIVKW